MHVLKYYYKCEYKSAKVKEKKFSYLFLLKIKATQIFFGNIFLAAFEPQFKFS